MSTHILSVINQKGGVGKSTISANLAYGLFLQKKRVLLIDLDPQAHASCIFCPDELNRSTVSEAFLDKRLDIKKIMSPACVKEKKLTSLQVIPSNIKLATVVERISGALYREKILNKHIESIKKDFDYIILDCPPTLGVLAINAIYAANNIIIPTNFSRYALDGMADLLCAIKEIKEKQEYQYFILKNLYEKKNSQTNKYINSQLESLLQYTLTTVIRKNEAVNQAQILNLPVQEFSPSSKGAQDFTLLTEEILLHA